MNRREEEEVLLPDVNWLSAALSCLNELPQTKRGLKRDNSKIATKYYNLVVSELAINYRRQDQKLLKTYHIRKDRIKRKLGEFTLDGKRTYWLTWFEQQPCSLYNIIKTGNNITEENTAVTLNWDFLSDLELESVPKELIEQHYDQITDNYVATKIDIKSLELYIARSRNSRATRQRWHVQRRCMVPAHQDWLDRNDLNLKAAVKILKLADTGYLRQPYQYSEFGRQYYQGINLQNVSKTVRHAALGHCWSIDFNVSSAAWRLDYAQDILKDYSAPRTLELIKDKKLFRQRVATILGEQYPTKAKELLTAIGFGADFNKKAWPGADGREQYPAIQTIVGSWGIDLLKQNQWFMEYMAEQAEMNEIILQGVLALTDKNNLPACVKDSKGRLNKNKLMAYLYQQQERRYMQILEDFITRHWGSDKILLTVHDGIYITHKINMAEINSLLMYENQYLTAECQEHWGHFEIATNTVPNTQMNDGLTDQEIKEAIAHRLQAEQFMQTYGIKQHNSSTHLLY